MSSQLQIEANRRNSQKSTGPRTTAGKVVSSQNALGSGIYAESETIRDENASTIDALAAVYLDRFHPAAPEQRCLVDILVHSEWTLRRLRRALNYDGSKVFARLQHRIAAAQIGFVPSSRGQTPFFAPSAKNGCLSPGFSSPPPRNGCLSPGFRAPAAQIGFVSSSPGFHAPAPKIAVRPPVLTPPPPQQLSHPNCVHTICTDQPIPNR